VLAEVTAFLTAATPGLALRGDLVGLGAPRPEDAQRGGYERSAAELHRLTARDCAGVQAHRQVVEGAGHTSFASLRQQQSVSFPSCTPQLFVKNNNDMYATTQVPTSAIFRATRKQHVGGYPHQVPRRAAGSS